jgi:hypothetical protein
VWSAARDAALLRDQRRCVQCGWALDWRDGEYPQVRRQYAFWTRKELGREDTGNWLEVDHIDPRVGRGYGTGCWNHQDNLRVLCHTCHVKVTRRQRIDRHRAA